ncbi:type II toxin-antitoxin system RelB/DinJ family antitoxin [Aerococcus christensenii]|uniref:type II toxin-antitoxin system RelB/DinJ family antitoxin n=1 Tax=Aerococcus christensenii TaxID=87541 RepID=UPI0023A91AC0|nr:type II toxin-antitoxin system RelB/DinJ family antitoxin [Aerococcus christensenii]WEB70554.1 type II toxin-antitoxin system RelB/DinJ family antitoxin [Aerococcus christensenii]
MTNSTVTVRMDSKLKEDTREILDSLGLDFSAAINIYFKQINMKQGLPFEIKCSGLQQTLDDIKNGNSMTFENEKDWWKWVTENVES